LRVPEESKHLYAALGRVLACALALLLNVTGRSQAPNTVKVVKLDRLKQIVRQNRGRVVVVFFWNTWNVPAIHCHRQVLDGCRKHKSTELVGISVCTDQLNNEVSASDRETGTLALLQRLRSDFTNLILDEKADVLIDKLIPIGTPCMYVFDRRGKWHRFSTEEEWPDWSRLEELIVDLLKEKP